MHLGPRCGSFPRKWWGKPTLQTASRRRTEPQGHATASRQPALEREIGERLTELDALNRLLLQESRKLEQFITGYLSRIGPYFHPTSHWPAFKPAPARQFEHQTRQQFHKLARRFHPDRQGHTSTPLMQAINQAYRERNLAQLKRIEIEADKTIAAEPERMARLTLRLQSLHTAVARARRMLDTIRASEEYLLLQKVEWNRRLGIDFIAELEAELQEARA